MNLESYKFSMSIGLLVLTLISGFYPFYSKRNSQSKSNFALAEVFSCGIFLGVGLLHLLTDAWRGFAEKGVLPWLALLIASVVLIIMLGFDGIKRRYWGQSYTAPILITVMISVHAFFEGAALGLSEHLAIIYVLFFAILLHKWAESFALAVMLNKKQDFRYAYRIMCFIIFSVMTPFGAWVGNSVEQTNFHYPLIEPLCDAIAAGTFIYFGLAHSLQHFFIRTCGHHSLAKSLRYWFAGFCLMGLVSIWV